MSLFESLPEFPPSLPEDELRLLSELPDWDTVQLVEEEDEAAAQRLERRGLIKVHRWKDGPGGSRRFLWAGKLPTASVRPVP